MLGRPWAIEGIVKRGEKRGRKIGFPTCNLELQDYVIPKVGVYASKIILNKNLILHVLNQIQIHLELYSQNIQKKSKVLLMQNFIILV